MTLSNFPQIPHLARDRAGVEGQVVRQEGRLYPLSTVIVLLPKYWMHAYQSGGYCYALGSANELRWWQ